MTTTLTDEQRQRIEQNRLRALEIQRQRRLQQQEQQHQQPVLQREQGNSLPTLDQGTAESSIGKRKREESNNNEDDKNKTDQDVEGEAEELEEFERGASDLVTKREAMQMYCLPEGTLAVCTFVEKDNPHRKGWTPMKLYHRHELRKRARKRFGGLVGLVEERRKRQERQFQKDMERSKQIFQTTRTSKHNNKNAANK